MNIFKTLGHYIYLAQWFARARFLVVVHLCRQYYSLLINATYVANIALYMAVLAIYNARLMTSSPICVILMQLAHVLSTLRAASPRYGKKMVALSMT